MDTPFILKRPRNSPRAITTANSRMVWAIPEPVKRSAILPFVFETDIDRNLLETDVDEVSLQVLAYR